MRVLRWGLIAVALLLSAAVAAAMIATQTDFGRDLVKRIALNAASKAIHGRVQLGHLSGDLLSHATIDTLVITDSTGAPFVSARRVSVHYGIPNLLKKRLWLRNVELDDPVIVLDQSANGVWNFSRIFPSSHTPKDTSTRGFGDWVQIRGLRIVNGSVIVRQPRKSDNPRLVIVGNQQITEINRLNADLPLVRIADPAQKSKLAQIASLNADLALFKPPLARIDNLAATVQIDSDSLWLRGARLAMPGSSVQDINTRYGLETGDLALDLRAAPVALNALRFAYPPLPTEGTLAAGVEVRWRGKAQDYAIRDLDVRTGAAHAVGHAQAHMGDSIAVHDTHIVFGGVSTHLIEQVVPGTHLPHQGIASGSFTVDGSVREAKLDADLAFDDTESGPSHLDAVGTIGMDSSAHGRVLHARHLALTLDRVQVELARTFVKNLPVGGAISGHVNLDGATNTAIVADADLTHVDRGQTSHMTATANAKFAGRPRTHPWLDIDATLNPFSLVTAGRFVPAAGLQGSVSGTTRVSGDMGDLTVHSHLVASGPTLRPPPPLITQPIGPLDTLPAPVLRTERAPGMTAATDSAHHPPGTTLAQAVANGEISETEVREGRLAGSARRDSTRSPQAPRYSLYPGSLGPSKADTDIAVGDTAGLIAVDGHVDMASKERTYDLTARAYLFNANAVTTKAPPTAITATAAVKGRGTDPATMQATVAANLAASAVDSVTVDSLVLRGAIDKGVARLDTAHVRLRAASADVTGTLGVTTKTTGHLTYQMTLDSLSALRRFLPADTGSFRPGPGRLAQAYARTQGDTGTGELTSEQRLAMDTAAIRRDLLSGWAHAAGQVDGSIQKFNVRGRLGASNVIAHGNSIRRLRADYAWLGAPDIATPLILAAQLDTVSVGTFELDSIDARVVYHKPEGSVLFLVRQRGIPDQPGGPPTHDQEYTANMDFAFRPEERRLRFDAMSLTFDTTTWTAPGAPAPPAVVEWGEQGVSVRDFNLKNRFGGIIAVRATVPKSGPLSAHADIQHLSVGELIALFESKLLMRGELSTTIDADGTTHAPHVTGNLAFINGTYNGVPVPDLRTRFQYDTTLLSAHAELATNIGPSPGRVFMVADGHVPIDLALDHDTTSRIPSDGPLALTVKADSMPLELLPDLVTSVQDVHGLATADLTMSGTLSKPVANGRISLARGTLLLPVTNIRLTDMAGAIRASHDSLTIDSLVATSQGKMKVQGMVDLTDPQSLPVDITITGKDVRIMNTKEYGWAVIDDSLTVGGSLRALSPKPSARLVFGGTINLTDGVFYAPETGALTPIDLADPAVYKIADTTDQATNNLIPKPSTLTQRVIMDVEVSVEPQVWVRNKEANVEIYTDGPLTLRVDDSRRSRFVLDGVVASERGQYTYFSKRFQITKGTATFIGTADLNPSVQATALYPVSVPGREPVNIQINIGGTAKTPTVALTSDAQPPLSQSDLISYLAFGSSTASLLPSSTAGGGGTGAGASGLPIGEAAAYVQQQLASVAIGTFTESLQGDLARTLDADVFNITNNSNTPIQFSQSGAQDFLASTRIEFGKYWDPQTYFAIQASPLSWNISPPGALVQRRFGQRTSILATFQPYFLLQQPTLTPLSTTSGITPTPVFGLFLLHDWRW
jgi:autotransporter translocation and assembly factor TamB